jgi:hypothetical protein
MGTSFGESNPLGCGTAKVPGAMPGSGFIYSIRMPFKIETASGIGDLLHIFFGFL